MLRLETDNTLYDSSMVSPIEATEAPKVYAELDEERARQFMESSMPSIAVDALIQGE